MAPLTRPQGRGLPWIVVLTVVVFVCLCVPVDWTVVFAKYDTDGSGQIDWMEFKLVCRVDAGFTIGLISDRELMILYKRLDCDQSGTISYKEWEAYLHTGATADLEMDATLVIQARQRGKMVRRHLALSGITMWKIDVEKDTWKLEVLTNNSVFDKDGIACGMWGVLSAALSKSGRGAVVFLFNKERAEWLKGRLEDKKDMEITLITGDMEPAQRLHAIDEWDDGKGGGKPDRDRYVLDLLSALYIHAGD